MGDSMPTVPYAAVPRPDSPSDDASGQEWTAFHLAMQAPACRILGSEVYAELLEHAAEDVRAGGPAWSVLEPHATRDTGAALALRFMAAVHRLVLTRRAGELAAYFPSVGGEADRPGAWPALRAALEDHGDTLTDWVGLPCQTNEVGRCAALAGGFLTTASETQLPLRLLEVGASAGLNLRWDLYHYRHEVDGRAWGDATSPVRLHGHWEVPPDLLATSVTVAERSGCDPRPIDPLTDEGRLALTAAVWGDQPVRLERLRAALQIATEVAVDVAAQGAVDWLAGQLAHPARDTATVVFQSVVMQYLRPGERGDVARLIGEAGARARRGAPLYWLRMEPDEPLRGMTVRMTGWPGGDEQLLARAGAHGDPVHWCGA